MVRAVLECPGSVMDSSNFRVERDSMDEVQVPASAYFGDQTRRTVENFPISGWDPAAARPDPSDGPGQVRLRCRQPRSGEADPFRKKPHGSHQPEPADRLRTGAALAKEAFQSGKTIRELCRTQGILPEATLREALDPINMTETHA